MKLKSTLPNMLISLGIITIIAGALLAYVHSITEGPIELAQKQKMTDALKSVLPPFNNEPIKEVWEWTPEGQSVPFKVYPAFNNKTFIGVAVEGYSLNGFSGEVKIMYGFDHKGNVTGYEVLSHAETPGLGAKMNEWFRDSSGNRSVIGKNPATTSMFVSKDVGGDIDAITAATISSRAFLETLRNSYDAFEAYKNSQLLRNDE